MTSTSPGTPGITGQAPQRRFPDVTVGDTLGPLDKGPMTTMHLMRWSASIENWHRIHYDRDFAVNHDGLPDVLINGSWKQHVLAQLLQDWAGPRGWVAHLSFKYTGMDVRGQVVTAVGEVREKTETAQFGVIHIDVAMKNDSGAETTKGQAVVYLPLSEGGTLPSPIPAAEELCGLDAHSNSRQR